MNLIINPLKLWRVERGISGKVFCQELSIILNKKVFHGDLSRWEHHTNLPRGLVFRAIVKLTGDLEMPQKMFITWWQTLSLTDHEPSDTIKV